MKVCVKCFYNFNGICSLVYYGEICEHIPVESSCGGYRPIPKVLGDKGRVLNPVDYTEEMEMADQGVKKCPVCNEIIDLDEPFCSCGYEFN